MRKKLLYLLCIAVILLLLISRYAEFSKKIHFGVFNSYSQSSGQLRGFARYVSSVRYDDINKKLFIGRETGQIDVWDMTKENAKLSVKGTQLRPQSIYLTKNNEFFSSSSIDRSVKLWSATSGDLICALPGFHGPVVETYSKGWFAKSLFVVAKTSDLYIFYRQDCQLDSQKTKTDGGVQSLGTSGKLIAVGNSTGVIELFEIQERDKKYFLERVAKAEMSSHMSPKDWVMGVHFSSDGRFLYAVSREGSVEEYEVPSLQSKRVISSALNAVFSTQFLPEENILALSGNLNKGGFGSGSVQILSLISGASILESSTVTTPQIDFVPSLKKLLLVENRSTKLLDFPDAEFTAQKPAKLAQLNSEIAALEERATNGDVEAQYTLARMYYGGKGVLENHETAALWYKKAAEQGYAKAQSMLGVMYLEGNGVPYNGEVGYTWIERAATQGHAAAQLNLGYRYLWGLGIAKDEKRAFEWFEKAAVQNNTSAQDQLGKMYYSGTGVSEDKLKSCEWYEKAAIRDDVHAQAQLGEMLLKGEGCEQDAVLAYSWLSLASDAGSKLVDLLPSAQSMLTKTELDEANALIKNWHKGQALQRKK